MVSRPIKKITLKEGDIPDFQRIGVFLPKNGVISVAAGGETEVF